MSWNYRVVTYKIEDTVVFGITEVYYDDNGKANGYIDPLEYSGLQGWENIDDLKGTINLMFGAFSKPVIDINEFPIEISIGNSYSLEDVKMDSKDKKFRITKDKGKSNEPCHFPEVWNESFEEWEVIIEIKMSKRSYFFPRGNYDSPLSLDECERIIRDYKQYLRSKGDDRIDLDIVKDDF